MLSVRDTPLCKTPSPPLRDTNPLTCHKHEVKEKAAHFTQAGESFPALGLLPLGKDHPAACAFALVAGDSCALLKEELPCRSMFGSGHLSLWTGRLG